MDHSSMFDNDTGFIILIYDAFVMKLKLFKFLFHVKLAGAVFLTTLNKLVHKTTTKTFSWQKDRERHSGKRREGERWYRFDTCPPLLVIW